MKMQNNSFNYVVETIYNLSLDERLEIQNLLEHNIIEARRDEISANYKKAKEEEKSGKLKSSSDINELKKKLR